MNKQTVVCTLLSGSLLLSGCSSMLEREYSAVSPHSATPVVESDQLTIRVESYQDLVNALMYFITQGRETGVIRLYNYPYDVIKDMEAACQEVAKEDPLGAYAVEDISFDVTPIVSCYEASIQIGYRRTQQQVSSIMVAAGSTAIREKLREALDQFQDELVLRINYFDEDEEYIRTLLWEAYLSSPGTALDFPQVTVNFYPEGSRQCIAEILLDYSLEYTTLTRRQTQLAQEVKNAAEHLQDFFGNAAILEARQMILDSTVYHPSGGATAYHALIDHQANSLGLALTMSLLCQQTDIPCFIVEGVYNGAPHYWNVISTDSGYLHLDLTYSEEADSTTPFHSDDYMAQQGYLWDRSSAPVCAEVPIS